MDNIEKVIKEIIDIEIDDGIIFEFQSMSNIRELDQYENFRVHLKAVFGKMRIPLKIDITTGDVITPAEIDYAYPKMFDEGTINIKAYPLETILAEKYETVLRRNIATTRMRDFYDLYILFKTKEKDIRVDVFKEAVIKTAAERGSLDYIRDWKSIFEDMGNDEALRVLWSNYSSENNFVQKIEFEDVLQFIMGATSLK